MLAEKVQQLKHGAAAADRVASFWEHQIKTYGEPKAEAFYKSLGHGEEKSVEYDGMTLWRDPVGIERTISLKAIQDAFDAGEKKLEKELLDLRQKLIDDAISGVIKLSPADYHTLVLDAPDGSIANLRDELQKIYDKGRELVIAELEAQGATNLGAIGVASDEDSAALDDLASVSTSRVINDLQSRVIGTAAGLSVLGLTEAEIESRLRDEVESASTAYVRTAAVQADHASLNSGRVAEMMSRDSIIREFIQSELLDSATCDPCSEDDGLTSDNIDDLPGAPNPNCDGAANCRGVVIAVFDDEEQ